MTLKTKAIFILLSVFIILPFGSVKSEDSNSLDKALNLRSKADKHFAKGEYNEALLFHTQSAEIVENTLGRNHPGMGAAYFMIGGTYEALNNYDKALKYYKDSYEIFFTLGDESAYDLAANVAFIYQKKGNNEEAIAILKELVNDKLNRFGESKKKALAMEMLAKSYQASGNYSECSLLREKIVNFSENFYGQNSSELAVALGNLALTFRSMGLSSKGKPLIEKAFKINSRVLGPYDENTAISLSNLALINQDLGDIEQAELQYKKAATVFAKCFGENHPKNVIALNNIALLYGNLARYKESEEILLKVIEINSKIANISPLDTALAYNNLSGLYKAMGDFAKSLPYSEGAVAIYEKSLGPEHPDIANSLNNLAELYRAMGLYSKALPLYERALTINEKSLGSQHPNTAMILNNMSNLYQDMGDLAKAQPLCARALAICDNALGPEHPRTATTLNNLAALYQYMGDLAKAQPLYERALEIREKTIGQHPDTAVSLNNLAELYRFTGNHTKALQLYEKSLAMLEILIGSEKPDTALVLNNMGVLYLKLGDNAKAVPLLERALEIREKTLGLEHPETAQTLNNLGLIYASMGNTEKAHLQLERALAINEKNLGHHHPTTATSFGNLALLKYQIGELAVARAHAERHIASKLSELQTILVQDEDTRLSWQSVNQSFWLACLLEPNEIADLVLRMKGVVLDSLVEDRSIALAAQSSGGGESLEKIAQLQARLSKLAFDPGQEEEVSRLKGEISQLQRAMAAKYLGKNLQRASATITQSDITSKLSEGSTLIDLFQFHDPKLKGEDAQCLGAIIITTNNKLEFVRIDGATAICQSIESLRRGIANGDAACVKEETELLSKKLWHPIAQKIPEGTNQLIISPDGDLNFLSFAALLGGEGKFLAESYDISYIGNARDLLRECNPNPPNHIRIFGNPIFDRTAESVEENRMAFRNMEVDVFGQVQLPPLPGTDKECTEIQKIAANSGWDLETFTRERADEKTIRQTSRPGILHLATHGFYLNSYTPPSDSTRGMSVIGIEPATPNKKGVDPMLASGIALTGAQSTLRSWAERKAPNPENDGILTAEEVASLDLQGTWLVSLSACETGVGEARSGEGVLGLRRSFMMAGAENLLMTLWPVSDQTTSEIMADFYREALKTGNAPGSLAKVQREWLIKLRKEKGLLEAVRDAGPFVMATIGKPLTPLPREPAKQEPLLDKVGRKIEALIQSSKTDIKNN